eukprot:symbB.v1.2.012171.t4/scaffold832.1/size159137/16
MHADPLEWAEKMAQEQAEPVRQMMRQPKASPVSGGDHAEPCDLFGDSRWMPLPRPKVHSAQVYPQYPQYPGYGGYSGYPGYMGYPGYHAYPGYSMGPAIGGVMGPAMPPGTEPEQIDPSDRAMALRMLAAALGSRVTDDMLADVPKATFAEAARLLLAVLGFMCEGTCPPMLRSNVVARGPHLPLWQGVTPHAVLRDWFDDEELLSLYAGESIREAFEAATASSQRHFVTLLSRVAFVEAARPTANRCLRASWQGIFKLFPEISLVRALFTHIRRRCWEDCRDRSRSRSRSRDRKKPKSEASGESQRFFLKNTGELDDWKIQSHFNRYGQVLSCNVLMDKRKKQYRGMGFITLKPEGYYRGKKNTKQMMIDWVLEESHVINGVKIEVTQADEKPEEDEDRKREDRIEERRLARLDKEQRMIRSLGGVAPHLLDRGQERLVASPWLKRWRYCVWETLPKHGPCSWEHPALRSLCGGLWREVSDHITRTADKTVKEALAFFHNDDSQQWSFIPSADLLLIMGDGLVTLTILGIFLAPSFVDATSPPSMNALVNMAIPTFASTNPSAAAENKLPSLTFSANPTQNRMQKGNFDDCKIFVGGLNLNTSVDQLMNTFAGYGQITDAVIMTDKMTGKPRGFGFIVFENSDSVTAVLQVQDKHHVNGKWVDVKRGKLMISETLLVDVLHRMDCPDATLAARVTPEITGTICRRKKRSKDDIRALWDKLDPSSTGEITAKGMMLGLYQVQLEAWPDLEQSELERLATLINMSAVRRLRSGGNNWYKIFNLVDKAHSGRLSFSSLKEVLRDMWSCTQME